MSEPTQEEVYRLCGIEQSGWVVHRRDETGDIAVNFGRDPEPSGVQVALRWIKLLDGRPYTRRSDGPYDLYVAEMDTEGSTLRVKVG